MFEQVAKSIFRVSRLPSSCSSVILFKFLIIRQLNTLLILSKTKSMAEVSSGSWKIEAHHGKWRIHGLFNFDGHTYHIRGPGHSLRSAAEQDMLHFEACMADFKINAGGKRQIYERLRAEAERLKQNAYLDLLQKTAVAEIAMATDKDESCPPQTTKHQKPENQLDISG